jgi:hypothetical protein
MATKPKDIKDGPPRWTYVAGSIVAIGGLVWGVVSYFIPKPELPKAPATVSAPGVTVSGNGSVGVGTMSGGQISVGAPATQPTAATSTPAKSGSAP